MTNPEQWTVRRRIAAGFGCLVLLACTIAILGLLDTKRLTANIAESQLQSRTSAFLIEKQVDHLKWVHDLDLHLLGAAEFSGQLDPTQCKMGKWLHDPARDRERRAAEGRQALQAIFDPHRRLHDSARQILELEKQGNPARARETFVSLTLPALRDVGAALNRLRDYHVATAEAGYTKVAEDAHANIARQWALAATALLAGLWLSWLVTKRISRVLSDAAGELASGAGQVAAAASRLSGSSQGLAQGASEQAASLEETSAAAEEIRATTAANSERCRDAAALVAQSSSRHEGMNRTLDGMVAAMGEIKHSSEKISNIIKAIDAIAFQTNILALNAAVEAARAGDAGMGFAVVADEVRNLAQRCAQAASETAVLIEDSIAKSQAGDLKVLQVAQAIRTIGAESVRVRALVEEVNAGSEEQTLGVGQIAQTILQMQQVTQSTAASAEEGAAASQQLHAQSESFNYLVARLTELVGGEGSSRSPAAVSGRSRDERTW
jgi:methyl-accepting chemotaxis protein